MLVLHKVFISFVKNRKFAPKAAERHIPICKNIMNRPINLKNTLMRSPEKIEGVGIRLEAKETGYK